MLPRRHRLVESQAFARTVRSRRRAGSTTVVVHLWQAPLFPQPGDPAVEGADGGPVRVGLIVSKAVGNAVVRTRVKRRLRHAVAPMLGRVPDGSVLVVRANAPAAVAGFGELSRDLSRSLDRVLGDAAVRTGRKGPT